MGMEAGGSPLLVSVQAVEDVISRGDVGRAEGGEVRGADDVQAGALQPQRGVAVGAELVHFSVGTGVGNSRRVDGAAGRGLSGFVEAAVYRVVSLDDVLAQDQRVLIADRGDDFGRDALLKAAPAGDSVPV